MFTCVHYPRHLEQSPSLVETWPTATTRSFPPPRPYTSTEEAAKQEAKDEVSLWLGWPVDYASDSGLAPVTPDEAFSVGRHLLG